VGRLRIEGAALLATAALVQLLRWLAARLGISGPDGISPPTLPAALLAALPGAALQAR